MLSTDIADVTQLPASNKTMSSESTGAVVSIIMHMHAFKTFRMYTVAQKVSYRLLQNFIRWAFDGFPKSFRWHTLSSIVVQYYM